MKKAVSIIITLMMLLTISTCFAETYSVGDVVNLLAAGYGSSDGTSGRRMLRSSGVYEIRKIVTGSWVKYPYGIGPIDESTIDGWVDSSMISLYCNEPDDDFPYYHEPDDDLLYYNEPDDDLPYYREPGDIPPSNHESGDEVFLRHIPVSAFKSRTYDVYSLKEAVKLWTNEEREKSEFINKNFHFQFYDDIKSEIFTTANADVYRRYLDKGQTERIGLFAFGFGYEGDYNLYALVGYEKDGMPKVKIFYVGVADYKQPKLTVVNNGGAVCISNISFPSYAGYPIDSLYYYDSLTFTLDPYGNLVIMDMGPVRVNYYAD